MKEKIISKDFYSNCLIQALKYKLKDWKNVKITYISPKYGESYWYVPHILWSDGKYDYDFGVERNLGKFEVFWYCGHIRQRELGWNENYKRARKRKYYLEMFEKYRCAFQFLADIFDVNSRH